jgi:AGCS family alanine or glycine:cation symporter
VFLELFNYYFTLCVVFPAIIGLGLYLTIKLKFIQITKIKESFLSLVQKTEGSEGNISRFGAIASVLAGNLGTGNISGMAVAIATGGPGALVWMWVMAFLGAVIQYASCVLGAVYRKKNEQGEYMGGPMYYLRDGLKNKKISIIFALCTIFGSVTAGNFAQVNSISLPLEKMGLNPLFCALGMAFFVGIIVLGGIKRLAGFATYVVPIKAVLYMGTALFIISSNYELILPAFAVMFKSAFNFTALTGGAIGFAMLKAMTTGFDRGLFATDAGTGIVPILQASQRISHPKMAGISTLVAPLMVMIVCTMTGLVLLITGVWQDPTLQSTNMVIAGFTQGLHSFYGGYMVLATLILFGYTTILAWCYCGEKASEFIGGPKLATLFRYTFITLVPLGTLIHVHTIWTLADIAITLMLCINLFAIIKLRHHLFEPKPHSVIT